MANLLAHLAVMCGHTVRGQDELVKGKAQRGTSCSLPWAWLSTMLLAVVTRGKSSARKCRCLDCKDRYAERGRFGAGAHEER